MKCSVPILIFFKKHKFTVKTTLSLLEMFCKRNRLKVVSWLDSLKLWYQVNLDLLTNVTRMSVKILSVKSCRKSVELGHSASHTLKIKV